MLILKRFRAILAGQMALFAVAAFGSTIKIAPPPRHTGEDSNVFIDGPGYFVVKDSSDKLYYTRHGDFRIDANGFLVNAYGWQLQGLGENLKTPSPIHLVFDGWNRPDTTAYISSFKIKSDGLL